MGKVVGKITDTLGLTNHKAEQQAQNNAAMASSTAAAATQEANRLAKENLDFQRQQYRDWQTIYGELQTNLGNYYNNLGTERIVSLGLQEQQKAHQQTIQQIRQSMAQRGIQDSKFETYMLSNAEMDNSARRAGIRSSAEDLANQQKMRFLGLGLGQGSEMLGQINAASNTGVSAFSNQANIYNNQFTAYSNNNAAMMRQLLDTGAEFAGTMIGSRKV